MASHHRGATEHCGLFFLTFTFSMVQVFNSKHNDSFRLHRLERLITWFLRLMVTRVRFHLFVYFTITKVRFERRIQFGYYKTRRLLRPLILFCLTVCEDFTLSSISVCATQKPAINVLSRCFYWMKPHFVIEETPVYSGRFLSPEERRKRNTEARRAKRIKLSPEEAAHERVIDRERWALRKSCANEARRKLQSCPVDPQGTSTLKSTADNANDSSFRQSIQKLKLNAANALHLTNTDWTKQTNTTHKALVCLICDCFVMTRSSKVSSMSSAEIKKHRCRLGVQTYENFQGVPLHKDLIKQYTVSGFPGMLLSPRSRKISAGTYPVCSHCKAGMKPSQTCSKKPPKFAIANGFAIGTFPTKIPHASPACSGATRQINILKDVNDVMKAFVAPVRPFGYVFQHFGGSQKCIQGHYQFFETDQNCVTGTMNYLQEHNVNNIFVMICGTTTPKQKATIMAKTAVDIELFKDLRTWFINNSLCKEFRDSPIPNDVSALSPTIIQDRKHNDTAEEVDPSLEATFGDTQYFFSSAQDPTDESSVYETSRKFACALVNRSAPTVLVRGGNFAKEHELPVEAVLPFAFPYGSGGPKTKRATAISLKTCIQRYFRLAMPQFMTADVVLVLHQLFSRQLSYETGIMTCRNQNPREDIRKTLSRLTPKDFQLPSTNSEQPLSNNVEHIVKTITTKCKSLAHTAEAAQDARRHQFTMMDHFGLNSLFLTITPDDECSFRVRLYADPDNEVRHRQLRQKERLYIFC